MECPAVVGGGTVRLSGGLSWCLILATEPGNMALVLIANLEQRYETLNTHAWVKVFRISRPTFPRKAA